MVFDFPFVGSSGLLSNQLIEEMRKLNDLAKELEEESHA